MSDRQMFISSDGEPFAIFYWGTDGRGMTKLDACREFTPQLIQSDAAEEDILEWASEPKLFWLKQLDEPDEEEFAWTLCNKDDEGAQSAFGVVFDI